MTAIMSGKSIRQSLHDKILLGIGQRWEQWNGYGSPVVMFAYGKVAAPEPASGIERLHVNRNVVHVDTDSCRPQRPVDLGVCFRRTCFIDFNGVQMPGRTPIMKSGRSQNRQVCKVLIVAPG